MQKIPLSLAKPGMILAKAVARDNGMVIVGEGAALTPALLDRLDSLCIEAIVVEGNPVGDGGAAAGTAAAARLERLDHLFRRQMQDPFMARVKTELQRYFTVKAAAEAARGPGK